jgi:LAO/AO transport system kinase
MFSFSKASQSFNPNFWLRKTSSNSSLFAGLPQRLIMTDAQINERVDQLLQRNRSAISRTITLIESSLEEHRDDADRIMSELFKRTPERRNHPAIRIGMCGSPGAGKSSLIEKLGLYIAEELKLNLAVLTIDPSS